MEFSSISMNLVPFKHTYGIPLLSETLPTPGNLDASIQKLSTIQLSDCRFKTRPSHPTTLLEQFLSGKGLEAGAWQLVQEHCRSIKDSQWKNTLLALASIVGQLLWAVEGNFIFGEWLIGSCQYILIQEYVRLLNSWCEWNKYSRHFIAVVSLLDDGESYKAFDLFMQCAKGVQQEPFIEKIILQSAEELTPSEAVTQYYQRVIQLFEQYSSQDCVIHLAKAAIDELDPSSPQLAMFQSIVFANHLSLEHYEEAYHSLIANTEPSRRKDCLRQLVVCLFEKHRLDLLMKFPYLGLQEELENIIESRARSMAIEENIYYDFLYAFYISKNTMRKAAAVMYEQALRCQLETKELPGIEHRYECLLACVTALSLADEDYRWIARPVISEEILEEPGQDDMEIDEVVPKQKVIVCELGEIRKELILTDAIITLAKHRKELNTIMNATPDDVITVLSSSGLYTDAVKLAVQFGKPLSNVLQGLAFACVRASDESSNDAWAWLQENDLADIPQKNSPSDMAWKLLEQLIYDNEEEGLTTLHKAVANKLLGLGEFLPHWLFLSYRERNASELLNLYVSHGRLVEATTLAKEYILAMTNTGGEYFGLKNALHATLPALCFPVNTIDSLLHNQNIPFNPIFPIISLTPIRKGSSIGVKSGRNTDAKRPKTPPHHRKIELNRIYFVDITARGPNVYRYGTVSGISYFFPGPQVTLQIIRRENGELIIRERAYRRHQFQLLMVDRVQCAHNCGRRFNLLEIVLQHLNETHQGALF